MKLNRYCILFILVAVTAATPPEQHTLIEGIVTSDVVAAGVPDATVGVDSLTRSFHRQTGTDSSGYYLVDNLEAGSYSVWAEVKGFGCIIYPHVVVFAGQRVREDFHFARAKKYPGNCEPVTKKHD